MALIKHPLYIYINFGLIIILQDYPCPCLLSVKFSPLFLRNRRLIQIKLSLGWLLWIPDLTKPVDSATNGRFPPVCQSMRRGRPLKASTSPGGSRFIGNGNHLSWKAEEKERGWDGMKTKDVCIVQDYLLIFVIYTREIFTACHVWFH
jgi:hypothetical protein